MAYRDIRLAFLEIFKVEMISKVATIKIGKKVTAFLRLPKQGGTENEHITHGAWGAKVS